MITGLVPHVARDHPAQVVLDMADVHFFYADGLRALIRAQSTITATGGQLPLRAPSPTTSRILALTGTERLFPLDGRLHQPHDERVSSDRT
jgi:anti-anti-sigma factor